MEGTIIKSIDIFMWLKVIGSGISVIMEVMGGDFGGFGAIREQITIATDKFGIIGEGFKRNRVY